MCSIFFNFVWIFKNEKMSKSTKSQQKKKIGNNNNSNDINIDR